tara:strand:- start:139 stop:396 length:258 start_codon:yes stop_codon:yes gene_type:complete
MITDIWLTIIIIAAIVWCILGYEAWSTPIFPADYINRLPNKDDSTDDSIFIKDTGSNKEKQYKKGLYNGKDDTWIEDNKIKDKHK